MVFFLLGLIVIIIENRHFGFNISINIDLGGLDFILFECDSSEYLFHLIMGNNLLPCISKHIPMPVLQLLLMIFMMVSLSRLVYLRRASTLLIGIWYVFIGSRNAIRDCRKLCDRDGKLLVLLLGESWSLLLTETLSEEIFRHSHYNKINLNISLIESCSIKILVLVLLTILKAV